MCSFLSWLKNQFVYNGIDYVNAILGGIFGLLLVIFKEKFCEPKVEEIGFVKEKVKFGILYKIKFKISRRRLKIFPARHPGICSLEIEWCGNKVFAKWDENPNPLDRDRMDSPKRFRPELVPLTYFQELFKGKKYYVPILHEDENGNFTVFSGWWFGRYFGLPYGPDPRVNKNTLLKITLRGTNINWQGSFEVKEIINSAKEK